MEEVLNRLSAIGLVVILVLKLIVREFLPSSNNVPITIMNHIASLRLTAHAYKRKMFHYGHRDFLGIWQKVPIVFLRHIVWTCKQQILPVLPRPTYRGWRLTTALLGSTLKSLGKTARVWRIRSTLHRAFWSGHRTSVKPLVSLDPEHDSLRS